MEFLIAPAIVLLAAAGLGLGLLTGRGPIRGSCGGDACAAGRDCAICPRRHETGGEGA